MAARGMEQDVTARPGLAYELMDVRDWQVPAVGRQYSIRPMIPAFRSQPVEPPR